MVKKCEKMRKNDEKSEKKSEVMKNGENSFNPVPEIKSSSNSQNPCLIKRLIQPLFQSFLLL